MTTLREELLAEVGETSEHARKAAVAELRERMHQYNATHAVKRTGLLGLGPREEPVVFWRADDTTFLTAMLRRSKYNIDATLRKLVEYSRVVEEHKEWTHKPDLEIIRRTFGNEEGALRIVRGRDPRGRQIWLSNAAAQMDLAGRGVSIGDQIKAGFWVMQGIHAQEETALNGVAMVEDWEGVSFMVFSRAVPSDLVKLSTRMMELYPIRLKRIDIVHQPAWIGVLFAMVAPLMTGKMRGRVRMHGGNHKGLVADYGVAALPEEMGGTLEKVEVDSLKEALRLTEIGYPSVRAEVADILNRIDGCSRGTSENEENESS